MTSPDNQFFTSAELGKIMENGLAGFMDDHVPVVRLFDPDSDAQFLITAMNPDDPSQLYGMVELIKGRPEIGVISLEHLYSFRNRLGQPFARDDKFDPQGKQISLILQENLIRIDRSPEADQAH